ncbi:GumC family protein [Spirosoma flavum]|uniref:non-specific protein-tyrosine kinase n=1 Tax=Spirosoma flavum TaxID=2048557 RepID=A0ABW6AFN9_9BACT
MDENFNYLPYQVVGSNSASPRMFLSKYAKRWPWFLLSVGLMLVGAYVFLLQQQPIYKIQASLLIQDETKVNGQDNLLKEFEVTTPRKVIENEVEILRSFPLMDRVVEKLHLDAQYYLTSMFGKHEIYDTSPIELLVEQAKPELYKKPLELFLASNKVVKINGVAYPLNQSIQTPYGRLRIVTRDQVNDTIRSLSVQVAKRSSVVDDYIKRLKAAPVTKATSVIQLSLEDAVPQKGEAILDQLIEEYNRMAILNKNKVATNALKFIEGRLYIISGELTNVEQSLESYKATQGITDLSTQGESFLKTAQENDALLNQVNVQLAAINDLQAYVNNQSNKQGSAPATVGLNDPTLITLINKMVQLQAQRDQLERTTSEDSPLLQTLDSQIKVTKSNMAENISLMKTMLLSSQQQYLNKNKILEGEIRTLPQKERSLMDITRQQSIKNNLYTYLLQKREETAVALASVANDSRTINPAQSSEKPVKPIKSMVYMLFIFLGILLPIAGIAGHDALNDRIIRRTDVEEATQIPIIGELVKKQQSGSVVITPNTQSVIAEQIRTLRADLQLIRNDSEESQVLLFTSSISGEGKSFISLNLGMSLALVDKKTVILEMDLRMPKIHKVFDIDNNRGICDYLRNEATLDDILAPVPGCPNYYIIPSGTQTGNPSELLSSPRLKQLIHELRESFDYILIDTPPVGLVSDARLISPLADATFFIVRHDLTPKNHLKMLEKLYHEKRFQRLNIILNAIDNDASYHYSSSYKYSYGYGQMSRKS